MTDFDTILDEAIRETGIERYRFLCSDANHSPFPNRPEDWRRFVRDRGWTRPPSGPRPIRVDYGTDPPAIKPCGGCP